MVRGSINSLSSNTNLSSNLPFLSTGKDAARRDVGGADPKRRQKGTKANAAGGMPSILKESFALPLLPSSDKNGGIGGGLSTATTTVRSSVNKFTTLPAV